MHAPVDQREREDEHQNGPPGRDGQREHVADEFADEGEHQRHQSLLVPVTSPQVRESARKHKEP